MTTTLQSTPTRRLLPFDRQAFTHKFSIVGHEGYITVNLFEDGTLGAVFITMSKESSIVSGMVDAFATSITISLQYGVPLKILVDKFSHTRFEPSGFTQNQDIPIAKSIVDYVFRWLGMKFIPKEEQLASLIPQAQGDAPPCHECGSLMVRSGSCYKCTQCGATSGDP